MPGAPPEALLFEITSPLEAIAPLLSRLADVSVPLLVLGLVFQLGKMTAMSQVWRRILREAYPAARIRRRDTLAPYVAGVGVNAIVPAKAGLVARAVLTRRRVPETSYEAITATMVVESLVGSLATAGLCLVATGMGVLPGPSAVAGVVPQALARVPGGLAGAALGLVVAAALAGLLARRCRGRIAEAAARFRQGLAILGHGRALGDVALGMVVVWIMRLSCIAAFLAAFGLDFSPRTVLLVVIAQALSGMVPVGPNGAGAQQGLMVLLLAGVATSSSILTFAIGMQAAIALLDVTVGAAALAVHGNPLHLVREIRATPETATLTPAPAPAG